MYVNNHKNCEIGILKEEISDARKELTDCRVQLHTSRADHKENLQVEQTKNVALAKQIKLVSCKCNVISLRYWMVNIPTNK